MIPRILQTEIILRHHENPFSSSIRHRQDGLGYGPKVQCAVCKARKYDFILVIADRLTKSVHCKALWKNLTAEKLSKVIIDDLLSKFRSSL